MVKEVGLPLGILERMHLAIGEDIPSLKLSLLEGIASVEGGFHYWRYQYWRVSRFIGGTGFIVGGASLHRRRVFIIGVHRFIGGGHRFIGGGIASSAEGVHHWRASHHRRHRSSLEGIASSASSVIIGGSALESSRHQRFQHWRISIGGSALESSRHWRHQQHNHTGRSAED